MIFFCPLRHMTSERSSHLAILASVAALSLGDAIIRATSLTMPLWQIFILRSALLVLPLWILCRKTAFQNIGWPFVRACLYVASWLCFYASFAYLPLSLAAACVYTAPVFILIILALLDRRPPGVVSSGAIALALVGVLLILRPDADGFSAATLLPILAGFLYACGSVMTARKCTATGPTNLALILHLVFIGVGALIWPLTYTGGGLVLGPWLTVGTREVAVLIGLAVLMFIGSVGAAFAYQRGDPATVATLDYFYLAFSLLWGLWLFSELPDARSLFGVGLIATAGIIRLVRIQKATSSLPGKS